MIGGAVLKGSTANPKSTFNFKSGLVTEELNADVATVAAAPALEAEEVNRDGALEGEEPNADGAVCWSLGEWRPNDAGAAWFVQLTCIGATVDSGRCREPDCARAVTGAGRQGPFEICEDDAADPWLGGKGTCVELGVLLWIPGPPGHRKHFLLADKLAGTTGTGDGDRARGEHHLTLEELEETSIGMLFSRANRIADAGLKALAMDTGLAALRPPIAVSDGSLVTFVTGDGLLVRARGGLTALGCLEMGPGVCKRVGVP